MRMGLGVLVLAAAIGAASSPLGVDAILTKHLGFNAADLAKVERGEVVGKTLPADGNEVAIAAAAMFAVPISFYLAQFERIDEFKRGPEVLHVRRFSSPPAASDVNALTLEDGDVEALRECRSADCDVKLDVAGMERVRRSDTAGAFRAYLAEYAANYLRTGNSALMEYQDEEKRPVADGLRAIIKRLPYLSANWPAVARAVGDYNGTLPEGLRDFSFWSKEKPPGKPIVSLTHAIIQPERDGVAVVATKQLYASHYMEASLGLTILVKRDTAAGPRTLVVYINRTRVDLFEGVLGRVKRTIVRARARGTAERSLGGLRNRLHTQWAAK